MVVREFSAGGLVYKKQGDQVLWLIRRPQGGGDYRGNLGWSFPKGWLDDAEGGEKPGPLASGQKRASETELQQAALREVAEEGGVEAEIRAKLPSLKIFFTDKNGQKILKFILYFVMEWREDLKEGFGSETAEIRWVTQEEALQLLAHKNEKDLLKEAHRRSCLTVA